MAKKQEQAALAVAPEETTALATDALDFDFGVSGLEEVDAEDIRFAVKVWNMKSKKPNSEDFFTVVDIFDTLTEQSTRELSCVFVTLHKTNDYSYFDNAKNETVRVCSSYDRAEGTLRVAHPANNQPEGTVRACDTCPDRQWRKDEKGKNVRDCSPVYGVIGLELDAQGNPTTPFMIRFKRTSLQPFKTHMQKHHIKRRKDPKTGKMVDVPLFAYAVKMKLQADPGGKFAVPVFAFRDVDASGQPKPLPREQLVQLADQAKQFREMAADVTKAAEKRESAAGADGAIDTTGSSQLSGSDFED